MSRGGRIIPWPSSTTVDARILAWLAPPQRIGAVTALRLLLSPKGRCAVWRRSPFEPGRSWLAWLEADPQAIDPTGLWVLALIPIVARLARALAIPPQQCSSCDYL